MKNAPEDAMIDILTAEYRLIPADILNSDRIELDLGCGCGSFTAALAKRYPETAVLAADVMIGRLRKLAKRNKRMDVSSMRLLRVEARNLIGYMLPDESIDRIHLLCPDPWPKDRHKGHRLLASDFVSQLHRVLKNGGIFHFASDDEEYFAAAKRVLEQSGIFAEAPEAIADVADIKSDFELRWIELGKTVHHIGWRKIPRTISPGH